MKARFMPVAAAAVMLAAVALAAEDPALTRLREKLARTTVTASFVDVPLGDVLEVLSEKGGVAVHVDPDAQADGLPLAKAKVTLHFDRTPLSEAIQRAADEFGLRVNAMGGLLWLSRRGLPDLDWPELPEATARALDGRALTLKFDATPLADALKAVSDQGGVTVRTETDLAKRPVTLTVNAMTPRAIVAWIAMLQGLHLRLSADGATLVVTWSPFDAKVVRQLDETVVSFTFNEQPVMEGIDFLQTLARLNIVVDRSKFDDPGKTVTLKCDHVPMREAMDRLVKELGLAWVVRDGVVFVSDAEGVRLPAAVASEMRWFALDRPSAADRKALAQLEETIVSFTFNEQPVFEAFDFLQTLGKVNIVVDRSKIEDPAKTVTLKLENVPLATAVTLLAEQLDLKRAILDGIVVFSDEETLKRAVRNRGRLFAVENPAAGDRAVAKKLDETVVSFTFYEQPVFEALDFLATLGRVNIVPDRKVLKDEMIVTLKLENVSLGAALRLLVDQLKLNLVIRGGAVYITDGAGLKRASAPLKLTAADRPPPGDAAVLEKLNSRFSFTLNDLPAGDVIDFLQTAYKVDIVLDRHHGPAADATVTLKLADARLVDALKFTTEQLRMGFVVREGAVFVTADWIARILTRPAAVRFLADKPADADLKAARALDETAVDLAFESRPPAEIAAWIAKQCGVPVVLSAETAGKVEDKATLVIRGIPCRVALDLLASVTGLSWGIREGGVVVADAGVLEREVALARKRANLWGVIVADEPSEADLRAAKRLDEVLPSVRIDAATVAEAAQQLRTISKLNVVIDPAAIRPDAHEVYVPLENVPLWVTAKYFAQWLRLCFVIRDGVLYFTDEAAAKSLIGRADRVFASWPPREAERLGYEAMKKVSVSFAFDGTPAAEAIDMLHVLGRVSVVVVDPAAIDDKKVTLKLDNVPLPLAFSLLAEQLGARWVLADGAVNIVKR